MSAPEAPKRHPVRLSPGSFTQPDDLKTGLNAGIATHTAILILVGDCERQLDDVSASLSPQNLTIRDFPHTLSHALLEASQSMTRQEILRMQLRTLSGHQRRCDGNVSALGLAVDRFIEARDESLRVEFAASLVLDSVANGTRKLVRHVALFARACLARALGSVGHGRNCGSSCVSN